MDERFAVTSAEENQKGLKAEMDTLHVLSGSCFSAVTVLKASKMSPLATQFVGFHQVERFSIFFHRKR